MIGSSMCIMVTGVAGFLGSHLLDRLLAAGHRVIGIDNLSMGSMDNILKHIENPAFRFMKRDVTHAATFGDLAEKVDCIVHLAAYKIPRYGNALVTLRTNSKGWDNILEFARRTSRKCVLVSTGEVYGRNPKLPFGEEDDSIFGSSKVARWSYAVSKLFAEHMGFAYQETYGMPVTVLRLFACYGPRHHLSWWGGPPAVFIEALLNDKEVPIHGDGLQTRCFTYVTDTIEGIYAAIIKPEADGEILNIGSTREISILELAETIHRLAGMPGKFRLNFIPYETFTAGKYEDVRRRVPDVSRSQQILEVSSKVSLEDGLADTIQWHRSLAKPPVRTCEQPQMKRALPRA